MSGSYLHGRVKRIGIGGPSDPESLLFEIEIANTAERHALILNHDVQLWQSCNNGSRCFYIASLLMDQNKDFEVSIEHGQPRWAVFRWPFSEEQLQKIEDRRGENNPDLQLRARFLTNAQWSPEQPPRMQWEHLYDAEVPGWPMNRIVKLDEWVKLLENIGFQSAIAPRISVPPFPPAFRRSAEILRNGWSQHFAGDSAGALTSSRNAIECLPFNLFDSPGELKSLVSRVLVNSPDEKIKAVDGLIRAFGELRHLACHEKGEPVPMHKTDSELALTCAAAILKYLAVHVQK